MDNPIIKETIERKIILIRGNKVMLSQDLAELYCVEVRVLNQAVLRNIERFPADFMFQLNESEVEYLKSQSVILNFTTLRRSLPYAFTEQGIAMLSTVLNSDRAVRINIEIMRVFVNLRRYLSTHKSLSRKLDKLEATVGMHGEIIKDILEQIRRILIVPEKKKSR